MLYHAGHSPGLLAAALLASAGCWLRATVSPGFWWEPAPNAAVLTGLFWLRSPGAFRGMEAWGPRNRSGTQVLRKGQDLSLGPTPYSTWLCPTLFTVPPEKKAV